jgi:aminoglycoside 2'-N-acetyltransferase I
VDEVQVCSTASLSDEQLVAIRRLLDDAFEGDFSDDDWQHSIGGTHALVEREGTVVAHASVVARTLTIGDQDVRAGYVEAVAVAPALQGTGLGTGVMTAIAAVITAGFEIGALSTGEWHFYERLGWRRWRGPTWVRLADGTLERTEDDDDGVMVLGHTHDTTTRIVCDTRAGDVW